MPSRPRRCSWFVTILCGFLIPQVLLAALPPLGYTLTQRPDGDRLVRFGPFDPATFVRSDRVMVGPSGELTLEKTAGQFVTSGWVELARVVTNAPFDTVQLGAVEQAGRNLGLVYQVRFFDQESGAASSWATVSREGESSLSRPARSFQVRVLLRSDDGQSSPILRSVVVEPLTRIEPPFQVMPGVRATVPLPTLVKRSAWGALPPKDDYTTQEPNVLTVHHSSIPNQAAYAGAATIQGIQESHMTERGWIDIGYHFLIGPDGKLYEGRPEKALGSHAPPNKNKIGICVIGDFNNGKDTVTAAQRRVLVGLLSHLAGKYQIPTSSILGHKDTQDTDCPGDTLYADLPEIRKEVDSRISTAVSLR